MMVKISDIEMMKEPELRELALRQQREIFRLQKDRANLRHKVADKDAVIKHLQTADTRRIVEAVSKLLPLGVVCR
ncbi:MAG: hypothetical protein LWW75_07740 [Chlorobiales bacterium]|nr:hypothetical protein [Chlorobiales bacterium]